MRRRAKAVCRESPGALIATALTSSWRESSTPLSISEEELSKIVPLLLGSGAGALGWGRVRCADLREAGAARELHQAYRLHTLQAEVHQHEIKQAVALLRLDEIEPVLIKGWSVARFYAERGLRPYGDIDLIVRPDQRVKAEGVLKNADLKFYVDVRHDEFEDVDDQRWKGLYSRTQLLQSDALIA
ncbi:MAG: nucleotidyltransferase family protein [Acidobacteria bacterium]|nr:nucleotidyltransferase family protein [Acidobacteriota bacterium]